MIQDLGKFLNKLKPKYDDDVVDRCNYLVTNSILFICALTVAAKQYVGEPLQCWVPAEFKAGWEKYIESYCFVENTYFVKMKEEIPQETEERNEREIHYYQWVPFILMLQALLFSIPRTVWKTCNWQTGMNIFALSQVAYTTKREGPKRVLNKNGTAEPLSQQLQYAVRHHQMKAQMKAAKMKQPNECSLEAQRPLFSVWRIYVTQLYIICKFLNLLNICLQFAIINHFLGPQYNFWGFGVLNDLMHGRQWSESGHFPRVTYCDVEIREIGNTNRKTVQCVLMINMFNEKIFLGIWFWLLVLGILTSINLLYWITISVIPHFGRTFIRDNLAFKSIDYAEDEFDDFFDTSLCKDSITVLRLISDNAGELVAAEVVAGLWNLYKENCGSNEAENCDSTQSESTDSTASTTCSDESQSLEQKDPNGTLSTACSNESQSVEQKGLKSTFSKP